MRVALVILLAFLGCRDSDPQTKRSGSAVGSATASAAAGPAGTGSAGTGSAAEVDPWRVAGEADGPPDLGERHRLANEACPAVTGPYFFRVEKNGKVSHLLGTRHIGVPLSKFPQHVITAIESARLAIFETAPDDHSRMELREIALREELGPDLWSRYEKLVGAQMAKQLEHAAPAQAILATAMMYEDISATLDSEIERKVIAAGIPTGGLETSDFQRDLIQKLLTLRMLRALIANTEDRHEIADEARKGLTKYCAGTETSAGFSEDTRADLTKAGYTKAELDDIDEQMVFARNERWIPKLERLFAQGNVFVAVGAGHLRGDRGVPGLLEKRGYKLTRITK